MRTSIIILIATIFFIVRMLYLYRQKKKEREKRKLDTVPKIKDSNRYKEFLEGARISRDDKVFSNGGEDCIVLLLLNELIKAGRREEIFIYEHSFPSKLFMSSEVRKALRNALALKTDIRVLYNEGTEDLAAFKEAMRDYTNISYREILEFPDSSESPTGIQLAGDSAFRVEDNEENHRSTFSFNQPHTVKGWKERLLNMWSNSAPTGYYFEIKK